MLPYASIRRLPLQSMRLPLAIRQRLLCACLPAALAFAGSVVSAGELPGVSALAAVACTLPSTGADDRPDAYSRIAPKTSLTDAAPASSERLETLDIVRVGLSLDVYRQGQVWAQLQLQNTEQPNARHVGTALAIDPRDYPIDATRKNMAWDSAQVECAQVGATRLSGTLAGADRLDCAPLRPKNRTTSPDG